MAVMFLPWIVYKKYYNKVEFYSPVPTNFYITKIYHITRPLADFPYVHTEWLSHSSIILEDTNGVLYMFE